MNSLAISTFAAVFVCLLSTAMAMPDHPRSHHAAHGAYPDIPAAYSYQYGVNDPESGNSYGQAETRNGAVTSGSYSVALPDGRTQKVVYTVNGLDGYVAEVTYSK